MVIPISDAPNAEIGPLLLEIIKTGRYLAGGGIRMWVKEMIFLSVDFICLASDSSWYMKTSPVLKIAAHSRDSEVSCTWVRLPSWRVSCEHRSRTIGSDRTPNKSIVRDGRGLGNDPCNGFASELTSRCGLISWICIARSLCQVSNTR